MYFRASAISIIEEVSAADALAIEKNRLRSLGNRRPLPSAMFRAILLTALLS